MLKQLTFTFTPQNESTFEDFYPGPNATIVKLIQNFSQQSNILNGYLWGGKGTGKTHLLQATCRDENHHLKPSTVYLPLKRLKNSSPRLLDEFESFSLICLDDIDAIAENSLWEETLFHFYNRLEAQKGHLLFSSHISPQNLPIQLPDLKSRIAASFVMEIRPLSDEEKLIILKKKAHARGFDLAENVGEFLMTHFRRDMTELMTILNQLDANSLSEKRRITIPFVKKVLE